MSVVPFLVSRRSVLVGTGALVLNFSLAPRGYGQEGETQSLVVDEPEAPDLPGSLAEAPNLDAWIRIDAEGAISVFTGKAELGQGLKTAILQIAAEELEVEPAAITLVTADTGLTPNEGYTAGSQSMQNSGTAIRHAAAQVRDLLAAEASRRWAVPADGLRAEAGGVVAPDGQRLGYGDLVSGTMLNVQAAPQSRLKPPQELRIIGTSLPRVDIPGKVTGAPAYVHDLRLPGMVHARVIRPPSYGARLAELDASEVEAMPGVLTVVRDGSFIAVAAEREFQAIKAMRMLAEAARWEEAPGLPKQDDLYETMQTLPSTQGTVSESGATGSAGAPTLSARFTRPYQIHGSIGPSCAVAQFDAGTMTVWTHTQGVYPDRAAISEMLGLPPEQVRCIHMEGSGCYGHNGADDAAADACLVARALPGRPVRLQWTREQEHGWEPFGPAMVTEVAATLGDDGRITEWTYDLWSNIHSTRPGPAGSLIAARHLAQPFEPEVPEIQISPSGNGDRNAVPLYVIPNTRVLWHFLPEMPLRVSALRGLGAYANVFSIESFMDDLAAEAGRDPVEFRLMHLEDERAREVVTQTAERFGWQAAADLPAGRGRGFGFARYKNLAAYCAVALEVEVDRSTGRVRVVRAQSAIDAGQIVNPNGIVNQTEGGILQTISWTLYEAVQFDETRITSIDWSTYPILRFGAVPESVEVHVVDRPGEPFLGAGEAAQGPAAAALANAIADATGLRLRDLPLTREKIVNGLMASG